MDLEPFENIIARENTCFRIAKEEGNNIDPDQITYTYLDVKN